MRSSRHWREHDNASCSSSYPSRSSGMCSTAWILFNQSLLLGLGIGIAMVLYLLIGGFFGAFVPLVLDRLGYDPDTSAIIFITTATDVLGLFIFLGLAQVVLL